MPPVYPSRASLIILPAIPPTTAPSTLALALAPVLTPHLTYPTLDLAIPLSEKHTFHSAQRTLANIYLALESVFENIGGSSCNIAVFFIAEKSNGATKTPKELLQVWSTRWKAVYAEKTLVWRDRTWEEYTVTGLDYTPIEIPLEEDVQEGMIITKEREGGYAVVAVGGTFDHIHAGHKLLLVMTAYLLSSKTEPNRLIVGVTGDPLLVKKKYREFLAAWSKRTEDTLQFLSRILPFSKESSSESVETPTQAAVKPAPPLYSRKVGLVQVECHELLDPAGPLITQPAIEALVVSGETREGGASVNTQREGLGWKRVDVFEVDVLGERSGGKISSTEIRKRASEQIAEDNRNEMGYY